jgi:hypothetical protein
MVSEAISRMLAAYCAQVYVASAALVSSENTPLLSHMPGEGRWRGTGSKGGTHILQNCQAF